MKLWQIKLKAFLIHLTLSAVIICLFLLVITQIWYPGPLFQLENVWQGLQILIPVDAILGPLLTLVLFAPGKKGLKLDISIIAIFQISALVYGGALIYKQRPVAIAFVGDRFEIVLASEEYVNDIPMERFINRKQDSPLLTYVLPPQTSEERSEFIINGINIKKISERHYPIFEYLDKIAEQSLDIDLLNPSNEVSIKALAEFKAQSLSTEGLLLLPLQSSTYSSIVMVIDSNSGSIKGYIDIDPWVQ